MLAPRRQYGQHPGLILQRYLTRAVTGNNGDPAERRTLLDSAIHAGQSESLRAIYADACTRWNDSFPNDDLNPTVELGTAGRLIVGLGSENVLETGIRLHHTYGVPLIPGSALKGLASHYCHEVWGQGKKTEGIAKDNEPFQRGGEFHRIAFGTTKDGGLVTFHDAWITPASLRDGSLRLDVMTPHHPKWQTNEAPPTDFDSPVPVSFLSVAGTFRVRLSWSGPVEYPVEQAKIWTNRTLEILLQALAEWGIGGKTSSGYGRLVQLGEAESRSAPGTVRPISTGAGPSGATKVTFLGPHDKLKNAFWVQEEGKKRGLLKYGSPPTTLPAVGTVIEVYPTNSSSTAPEYRWDKPTSSSQDGSKGGPGSQRPRGRR